MRKLLTLSALAILITACASQTAKMEPTEERAAKAIAAADAARKEAASAGFEWRDTGKIIKQAKDATSKKDYAKATQLAERAERQSHNALKQAAIASK